MSIIDLLTLLPIIVIFVLYPLLAWPTLRWTPRKYRLPLFAFLNVVSLLILIGAQTINSFLLTKPLLTLYLEVSVAAFLTYLLFVLFNFAVLRWGAQGNENRAWIAFLFPLLFLCIVKYCPAGSDPFTAALAASGNDYRAADFFVGISYMAFRLSRLVREVQSGAVPQPSIAEYLAFAFFMPAMSVGPINPYSNMQRSLSDTSNRPIQTGRAWLRILIGLTKYLFLSTIFNQFTYAGLLLDGHPHRPIDLLIATPAYTLYLYCNFSGFCDMVIGTSALLGIEVSENFDQPFTARNLQEFWNRWHITLSVWFRDMMFTPMLKSLVRLFGPGSMNRMIAITILAVFLVLGVWHGTGVNFLIFGLLQGIGVATVHYYRLGLKRFLTREAFAAYQRNAVIRVAAMAVTFAYFSFTLFFFANSLDDMRRIAHAIV